MTSKRANGWSRMVMCKYFDSRQGDNPLDEEALGLACENGIGVS